jgi:class 3 adenylate cyclase
MEINVNETLLEETLAQVEQARNWSPRLISKLEHTIRNGSDEELFRLNPILWAQEKNVDENEAIDLFLHSAKVGLFYMDWNVICPCCGKVMRSLRNLYGLQSENTCSVCFRKDRATLDDYVQVTFTLVPAVRDLRFHHPESLSLEDYCFKYLFERGALLMGGAQSVAEFIGMLTKHFSLFGPGEKVSVEMEAVPGLVCVIDMFSQKGCGFLVDGPAEAQVRTIPISLTDSRFELPLPELRPGEFQIAHKFLASDHFYSLRPGKVVLELEQSSASQAALVVWSATREDIAASPDVSFKPCLSAKRLFTCQTFNDLFRSEVFQESEGFGVKDITILFTDLKSSTQLYNQIGDLNAFALVREHYGVLDKAITDQHGAVVKTIGDAIMATFGKPEQAVAAGMEMLRELKKLNKASPYGDLLLKIGIHRGAAISVTLNEHLDYFGQTINIAARVQGMAGGNEIYLTDEIYRAGGVPELLEKNQCQSEAMLLNLKGIEEPMKVYKVTGVNTGMRVPVSVGMQAG